jgi:hypothetical protein
MKRRTFLNAIFGGLGTAMMSRRTHSRNSIVIQESPIAGLEFYRAAAIWPFLRVDEKLSLVRERFNEHDPSAVAVYFRNDKLGFVPRQENGAVAQMLDRGEILEARITRLINDPDPWRQIRISISLV